MLDHLLFVPVVDLMNISEHNLVFALHVIRNPLLLHPAHVALQKKMESPRTYRYQGDNGMDVKCVMAQSEEVAPPTATSSLPVRSLHIAREHVNGYVRTFSNYKRVHEA